MKGSYCLHEITEQRISVQNKSQFEDTKFVKLLFFILEILAQREWNTHFGTIAILMKTTIQFDHSYIVRG